MVERPVRERRRRRKKKGDWVKVEREEKEETKGEQRGLEALFVGTVSRNSSSSSSPFDLLSPRSPASLYGAKTQVSVTHTHTVDPLFPL